MRKIIILSLATCIAISISSTLRAYTWNIKNGTDQTLLVQVELLSSTNPYFNIVKPGETSNFSWKAGNWYAGYFLGKVKYVIVDNSFLEMYNAQGTFLNADKSAVIDNKATQGWLKAHNLIPQEAPLQYTNLYFPSETYDSMIPYTRETPKSQSENFTLLKNKKGIIALDVLTSSRERYKKVGLAVEIPVQK